MDATHSLPAEVSKIEAILPYMLRSPLPTSPWRTIVVVTVTDKGQLTVPQAIRERLGIRPGTKLHFELLSDGSLRVRVLERGAGSLFGLLQRPDTKPYSVEEMDAGIAKAVSVRGKRSKA
jgi:antitoxin PrlF